MYDRIAQFYEWEHQSFRDDLPLYLGFARTSAGPILDAACGTGRVSLPLAEQGYAVTGVDASAEMLAIARSKIDRLKLTGKVRLVQADLRTMKLAAHHGMALVALGSFHHLETIDDQRRALHQLASHLLPSGLLLIDLVNPSPEWLAAGDGALVHQTTAPFPGADGPGQLSKFVARSSSFDTQTERLLLIYDLVDERGAVTRHSYQLSLRYLFRYEAELLLAEAGFRLRDVYGDYDLESYQASSPRMILVAEKR